MGRNRGNRNRPPKHQRSGDGEKKYYDLGHKTNPTFEKFYQIQGIVPESEWDTFLETLRKPLPSTFRITGFKRQAKELLKMIKSEYFDNLMNIEVEGRIIDPPKALPWYPEELAWQLDLDRKFIRKSDMMKKLHMFLVEETESGNISRQEAVSMIPPLVLDVQPHHKVLDMCAAPGSKTAQLIEMLHADDTNPVPEGCVVANDSDNRRCYLMTHQVKRLETPSFLIINEDATCMPNFKVPNEEGHMKPVKFDRILADVPCSGDGTMRKNVDAWGKWHVHTAMHLHNIQSRILSRGLEMLAVGGRIVYSTCSLNPMENEAVVSNLLRKSDGAVRLVDVSASLPGLKWIPGLSKWKVMSRDLDQFATVEDVPEKLKSSIRPSVFPPSPEEAETFQLHKCMRVLPHHQDTGGFFISVLEKTDELPWVKQIWTPEPPSSAANSSETPVGTNQAESSDKSEKSQPDSLEGSTGQDTVDQTPVEVQPSAKRPWDNRSGGSNPRKKRKQFGYKEDPFIFLSEEDPIWPPIKEFYGLKDFPADQLLVRCMEGKKRNVYFTSAIVKSLVVNNIDKMKIINTGLKILCRSNSPYVSCDFRTVQEGILVLIRHVSTRIIQLTKEDVVTLLSTEMPFLSKFSKSAQDELSCYSQGSVIFVFNPETDEREDSPKCRMVLCGWLGKTSCRSFIALNDRGHYMRMCGAELQTKEQRLKRIAQKKEKEQAKSNSDAAAGETVTIDTATEVDASDDIEMESESESEEAVESNGAPAVPPGEQAESDSATALPPGEQAESDSTTAGEQAASDSATALPPSEQAASDSATALPPSEQAASDSATALPPSEQAASDSATALPPSEQAASDSTTAGEQASNEDDSR